MGPETTRHLVGLALACGAAGVGGPLSAAENALCKDALPASPRTGRKLRVAIRAGSDPLGDVFYAIRSPFERRRSGAFYTGRAILEPMLAWALAQKPSRLVDPGCGSGRFSTAAVLHDPGLAIVAIDCDPLATLSTRAALAAVGVRDALVLNADYLCVDLPAHDGVTAFVGNPPYVRHHHLDAETKALARHLAARTRHRISGLAGLHALFYLATLAKHGRSGDVGAFVTSAEWLDIGYGSIVREMFTNGLGGRSLTVFDSASVPFDDAMTTAAITTFRLGQETAAAHLTYVQDSREPITLEDNGRDVERTLLAQAGRWSGFVRGRVETTRSHTLGSRFRVKRGQVTGANGFFLMTRDRAKERGIERFCVPLVTAAREVFESGGVLRNDSGRLVGLEVPRDVDPERYPRLAAYIREGETRGIHKRYVAAHRSPWWAVSYPKPPVVATYMARQAPHFATNPDRLGLINIAHGLYPRAELTDRDLERVVDALNCARASFVGRGRTYHGGLEKFEPGEMEALPLPVGANS